MHVQCELGIDLSTATSVNSLKCLLEKNYRFINIRAWRSYGGVDPEAPQTIKNARDAGYPRSNIGVYMFPCVNPSTKPIADQVEKMLEPIKNSEYDTVWVDM